MAVPLFDRAQTVPAPAYPDKAEAFLADFKALPAASDPARSTLDFAALAEDAHYRRCLEAIFGNSRYLSHCLLRDRSFARMALEQDPDTLFDSLTKEITAALDLEGDRKTVERELRIYKRRATALIAFCDIFGLWPLAAITAAVSTVAETSVRLAVNHLLREEAKLGRLDLPERANEPNWDGAGSGYIVLGMGKLGGGTLNYSSDIDLIVLYDDSRAPLTEKAGGRDGAGKLFVRLTRALVGLIDQRTADGYVFRTDLRLRPDPGATPVAVSTAAAEAYYGSLGQNWERAAMIRARPIAGDPDAAAEMMAFLRAWVWRRHLDFATIQDIHAIKRQIASHKGHAEIKVAGHNVKLGRGGIREIEFYIQTQQLIYGGRDNRLRSPDTLQALNDLTAAGWVMPQARDDLQDAYRFLRRVEHRLQMVDDRQTHILPEDTEALAAFTTFLGYADPDSFAAELTGHLQAVQHHYADLFEESPPLSDYGSLVFTGPEADPETLETLAALGFTDTKHISDLVQNWHRGRYRAMRSERSRQLMTELIPGLLHAFGDTPHPDNALQTFDRFLGRLPAGIQLLSMFHQHPHLMQHVALVMGTAPRLSEQLAKRPALIDSLLDNSGLVPGLTSEPTRRDDETLSAELERVLADCLHFEQVLDRVRQWAAEKQFLAAMAVVHGSCDGETIGPRLSGIAETCIAAISSHCCAEFAAKHGDFGLPLEQCISLVGFGKLGSGSLSFGSDLDLVAVYDLPPGAEQSNGPKPLAAATYFTRLTQRLVSALTTQTGEGRLFEVDLRLRPYGDDGPLASSLTAWQSYYRDGAWIWELMALTRARPVSGAEKLRRRIEQTISKILSQPRDLDQLTAKATEMRRKLASSHPADTVWQVKHTPGGLIDCEFTIQTLVLYHAVDEPELIDPDMHRALQKLADKGCLPQADADALSLAMSMCLRVQGYQRLTQEVGPRQDDAPTALKRGLAQAAFDGIGVPLTPDDEIDFDAVRAYMVEVLEGAHDVFRRHVLEPGETARKERRDEALPRPRQGTGRNR